MNLKNIIVVCFCFFLFSCSSTMNTDQYRDLRVYIGSCKDREMVENFVKDKKEYYIEDDNVYCIDLDSKVKLKRFLIFNDFYHGGHYYTVISYKSKGELHTITKKWFGDPPDETFYLPEGVYRVLIFAPQLELQNARWDDYVTSEKFFNKRNLAFYLKHSIVDEKKYSSLNLKKILSYFEDGQRFGFNFNREGIYVLDRESSLFDDFNVNRATIIAFLIENGYFVYTNDYSGHMIIDLY